MKILQKMSIASKISDPDLLTNKKNNSLSLTHTHLKVASNILSCELVNIHQIKNLFWLSFCIISTYQSERKK